MELYKLLFHDFPDVVNVEQMSQMLTISTKTGYKLLRENKIEHFKIGKTYKIPKISICNYMNVIGCTHAY